MPVGLSEAVRVPVNTVKIVSVAENTRQNCKEYANAFSNVNSPFGRAPLKWINR